MNSARTQIARGTRLSAPTRFLLNNDRIWGHVLHHGAGKAQADTEAMIRVATTVAEYDPNVPAISDRSVFHVKYDVVVSNYVLNVLPMVDRFEATKDIANATRGDAFITVRAIGDRSIHGDCFEDGVQTSRGTFQKAYTHAALKEELAHFFAGVEILQRQTRPLWLTARCWYPR